ncbi:MAG: hypothetical protein AB7O98_09480 [Hyphomonadaceae bacterium]
MTSAPEQTFQPPPEAESFYVEGLQLLAKSEIPFLLSGTYAVTTYTGIVRPTKDLDIFCKASDYPRILAFFRERGYQIEVEDERWIAKIFSDRFFFDVIFSCRTTEIAITDEWFDDAPLIEVYGADVRIIKPTELIWSKIFVQDRYRYDGADVAHVLLKQHDAIDWHRLLRYMELHWEVLLTHLINFRYIYPSERDKIPRWVMDELVGRINAHLDMPPSKARVCRGRLFSARDYVTDITEWGYADLIGMGLEERHDPVH